MLSLSQTGLQTAWIGAGLLSSVALLGGCASTPSGEVPGEAWNLVWSDEFEGTKINSENWTHEVWAGVQSGNQEFQYYTDRSANSYVEDGRLVIQALREDYLDHKYTSARLIAKDRFSFLYGRIEGRIRIPSTVGIWPAFWMMPQDSAYGGWPLSGEIDILESVNIASEIYGTIHFGDPGHQHTGGAYQLEDESLLSDDFHVYAVEWEPGEMRWYVDGELYSTKTEWATPSAPWPAPFDQEFYPILNVAVGGTWPGPPDESSEFPQTMEVDWVRVYQTDNRLPEVRVLYPPDGERLAGSEPVEFSVSATDPDGEVVCVQVWSGSEMLAQDMSAPWILRVSDLPDDCYSFDVMAYDDAGMRSRKSVSIELGIGCPQLPFGGSPAMIPGTLEAEHFDEGKAGEAYSDGDPANNGRMVRPNSAVDIGTDDADRYYLGWCEPDEWVEYTVRVAEAGTYRVVAVVASGAGGGAYRIVNKAGETARLVVPATDDWNTFVETSPAVIRLPEGETVLRLEVEQGGINVDSIHFSAVE